MQDDVLATILDAIRTQGGIPARPSSRHPRGHWSVRVSGEICGPRYADETDAYEIARILQGIGIPADPVYVGFTAAGQIQEIDR